jgi:multidrug efflux system outer membrane protein
MKRDLTNNLRGPLPACIWIALLVLLSAVLSGCPLSKPPSHGTVVDQALPPGTTIPPVWSALRKPSGEVTEDWLESFHDPRLTALVAEAINNNLDLRQAAARVQMAQQNVVVVGSKLLPQIGAKLSVDTMVHQTKDSSRLSTLEKRVKVSPDDQYTSNMEYGLISWEIDLWGRLRAQRAAAAATYEATALDYAFARQSLAATTAKSWYQENVKIYSDLLKLVQERQAAGKVADLDVAEARASLSSAQSMLTVAQENYREAQRNLEVLLGRYPAAELKIAEKFAPLPPPVRAGLPASLLERRPDLVAAERQVLAAFRLQESAKLALLPSISLTVEGGRLSDKLFSVLNLNPWLFHSALGMFVPIYQGGALIAQIKIATAEQEQAVARYGSLALKAFREVEATLTNEQLYGQRLNYVQNEVKDRTETVRIAAVKYQAGTIDLLSGLILQAYRIASEAEDIKLRNLRLANRINLHLALGGSFEAAPAAPPNLMRVSQGMAGSRNSTPVESAP